YSPELLALRQRLRALESRYLLAFIAEDNGHYSGYRLEGSTRILEHGDSLLAKCAPDIGSVLNWILAGISGPLTVESGIIQLQPGIGPGSGSCGVAAFNFIEEEVDNSVPAWTPIDLPQFRRKMLLDLVVYH
ncbi:hypothetical protein BDP27DRAFT_1204809, partial [Rhodocollybia butyracea]